MNQVSPPILLLDNETGPTRLLSPFRYPGGKTWLASKICYWLTLQRDKPAHFIEPFAGGAIVGLNVAFKQLAERVTLVELDQDVAVVWQVILEGEANLLADLIIDFDLTPESVSQVLSRPTVNPEQKAFRTILRNRINRNGILASGAGVLKNGENGKGIRSRWYPETLARRIREVARLKNRITFIEGNGLDVLRENADQQDTVFFIDPPYTAGNKRAGSRLYTHYQVNHEELFRLVDLLTGDFLMTYSNEDRVLELARRHNFDIQEISMRNGNHKAMSELLIGRDLDWYRQSGKHRES